MMKKRYYVLILSVMLLCTSCSADDNNGVSVLNGGQITDNSSTEEATKPEVPEGAIVDESGDFVYNGKLQTIGDDENGYIQVPLGYIPFQEEDVEGMTQYSDAAGTNIFTLEYYEGLSYTIAAENMRYYLEEQEDIEGLNGAVVKVAGYDALQLYCHYTDGIFLTIWLIQDPDDTESCYYLAIEFDSDHQNLIACSSTFRTVNDYHQENVAST